MFARGWRTSARQYGVRSDHGVAIPVSDGVVLDGDVFRPAAAGRFPALLSVHAYDKAMQWAPSRSAAMNPRNAQAEAGDPRFYARRGYAHAIVNVRGTGASGGRYSNYSAREARDIAEAIEWLAEQPWCDGRVGMFGVSYFAVAAKQAAALAPPALGAVFAPYGYTDFYRDKFFHGGILAKGFLLGWSRVLDRVRPESWSRTHYGESEFAERLARAREDPELARDEDLARALDNPDEGPNPLVVDVLLNDLDGPYWHERNPALDRVRAPMLMGGDWSMFGLHLPGDLRAWERVTAPKRMILGPPIYLDRPVYQYAYESLRWFDQWLKDEDTAVMDEAPVRLFVPGSGGRWKHSDDWPLPETRWHPFHLHGDGLLSEHDHWPGGGATSYEDNVYNERGAVTFSTPPFVEETEMIGPSVLTLYASTSATEVLWFASLWAVATDGGERLMTRGWLRGSMRASAAGGQPWDAPHPFDRREPLTPGEVYEFHIGLMPTANLFAPGERLVLRVSSSDLESPTSSLDFVGAGHLLRTDPSWITILHDEEHPSRLDLPITSGNLVGTFLSGGKAPVRGAW
jgi:uncharacterized protein